MRSPAAKLAFLVVSPAAFLVALLVAREVAERPPETRLHWDDDLRREVQSVVGSRYVDPLDPAAEERLFHAALEGYVSRLDPFSRFIPASERPRIEQESHGVFGGIGVRASLVEDGLRVVAVRRDSPADRAGLEPGDLLERVAGEPLAGLDMDRMLGLLRGEAGSSVAVGLRRGGEPKSVTIERGDVPSDTVRAVRLIDGAPPVAYVRVEQFADTTPVEVRDALDPLIRRGARGIVLDLRQNLGGVVASAVRVASLFLPEQSVVCVQRRREGGDLHIARPEPGFPPTDLALVLLVDESTASASEILAGALQDHGRALLVGERTWGKFLVQTRIPVKGGAMVQVTTARYETPRGRSAPRDDERSAAGGLVPEVRVPFPSESERNAVRAAFARQFGPHWRTEARTEPEVRDVQLAAALDLLRGGSPPPEPVRGRW